MDHRHWQKITESIMLRALKRAEDVRFHVQLRVICFDGDRLENCTLCLDSQVESRSLRVVFSSGRCWEFSKLHKALQLIGLFCCGLVRGYGHHTKCVVALARWGYCIVFCFSFFLIVVPSYLLVHSICTKKLDWWAAVCLFWEEWNSVFSVCSHLTGL